jgi:hypothetical protein
MKPLSCLLGWENTDCALLFWLFPSADTLQVDHPAYKETVVMAYAECLVDACLPATKFRSDFRDLPADLQASIMPTAAPTLSAGDPADDALEAAAFGEATAAPPTTGGITVQRLIAGLGEVRILDVPVDLGGRSDYLQSVLGVAGGYDVRMREKGLSPYAKPAAGL